MNLPHTEFILWSMMLLGLRHGLDHDHVAAITDITSLQRAPWRAMKLGLVYAAGHAVVLFALGAGAVLIGLHVPVWMDVWREKIVGATLIALGLTVVGSMIIQVKHHPHNEIHLPTRFSMVSAAWCFLIRPLRHIGFLSTQPNTKRLAANSAGPAFAMGLLHGVGAETPSQLLLLVVAAGMGTGIGLASVGSFVGGLFFMNTAMCAVMVGLYRRGTAHTVFTTVLSAASAVYSVAVGMLYLMGAWI